MVAKAITNNSFSGGATHSGDSFVAGVEGTVPTQMGLSHHSGSGSTMNDGLTAQALLERENLREANRKALLRRDELSDQLTGQLQYAKSFLARLESPERSKPGCRISTEDIQGAEARMKKYLERIEANEDIGFSNKLAELYLAAQRVLVTIKKLAANLENRVCLALVNSLDIADPLLKVNTLDWLNPTVTDPRAIQISIERFLTLVKIICLQAPKGSAPAKAKLKKIFNDAKIPLTDIVAINKRLDEFVKGQILSRNLVMEIQENIKEFLEM